MWWRLITGSHFHLASIKNVFHGSVKRLLHIIIITGSIKLFSWRFFSWSFYCGRILNRSCCAHQLHRSAKCLERRAVVTWHVVAILVSGDSNTIRHPITKLTRSEYSIDQSIIGFIGSNYTDATIDDVSHSKLHRTRREGTRTDWTPGTLTIRQPIFTINISVWPAASSCSLSVYYSRCQL